jgi:hypothetical protein
MISQTDLTVVCVCVYIYIYLQGDKKVSVQYKNTQKYFKQFQSITMIT